MQERLAERQAKMKMVEQKQNAIRSDLANETANLKNILNTAPVKINASNASDSDSLDAIMLAIKELQTFYSKSNEASDGGGKNWHNVARIRRTADLNQFVIRF